MKFKIKIDFYSISNLFVENKIFKILFNEILIRFN